MNNLWLGSQSSFETVLEAKGLALANYGDKSEEAPLPILLSVQGSVGIIKVSGSLVSGNAGYMCYYGVTGYGDIRDALVAAIQHPEVSSILMDFNTGGGAVAGCHETAQLIARVDKVKPVVGYNGGTQASAGLWLGSSVRSSYISETAITGSLGIIMVHAERSKQLEQDGIKVTVIRAGAEKALASQYEVLTKEAKAGLEAQAETLYGIFLGHVASQRSLSTTAADTKFGQGREFIGQQAVDAGLVDHLGSFEDAYLKAQALGEKASKKASKQPNLGLKPSLIADIKKVSGHEVSASLALGDNAAITQGTDMPKPLTQEDLVAMAAGVTLDDAEKPAPVPSAEVPPADTASTEVVVPPSTELTAYLQNQVASLQLQVATLAVASKTLEDAATASKATLEALAEIGRNSVKTMTVALGGKAEAITAMSASDVVTEHARVSAVFKAKFKVGGVAATDTSEGPKPAKADVNPLFIYAAKSL